MLRRKGHIFKMNQMPLKYLGSEILIHYHFMWWWWGLHSPPLAYSIIRYRVFSVSITSNNWTATNKEIVTTKRTNLHTRPQVASSSPLTYVRMIQGFHDAYLSKQLEYKMWTMNDQIPPAGAYGKKGQDCLTGSVLSHGFINSNL